MNEYILFPFGKVDRNSNIIIYGAGEIGEQFIKQVKNQKYCNIVFCADRNYLNIPYLLDIKVIDPKDITKYHFDYIIIASIEYKEEILNSLEHVKKEKIITIDNSNYISLKNLFKTPGEAYWDKYYADAEAGAVANFNSYIKPIIDQYKDSLSFERVLDFACGRGRIAEIFADFCNTIVCSDIDKNVIEYCKKRFRNAKKAKFEYVVNNENSIELSDESISFLYSWDAMVHFSYKWLDYYASEFHRILTPGGYGIVHHSNLANIKNVVSKSEEWSLNPCARSNISKEDFRFILEKHGFQIIQQRVINWQIQDMDCITLFKKN